MSKNKKKKVKDLTNYKAERGEERKKVLEAGGTGLWIRPPMVMEARKSFKRSRQKEQLRRDLSDAD